MGANGVFVLPQNKLPPREIRKRVASETLKVKQNWKRTVDGILAVGCSLLKIKAMLPHKIYVGHIQENFGLNEMGASRFISVYRRFGRASSGKVLRSKVSVLYLLANSQDLDKVDRLARGGKIIVSGKRKSIDQLNVSDASKLRKTRYKERNLSSRDLDIASASDAHRRLCTLAEEVADWCSDIERIKKRGLEIRNVNMVKDYLREVALAANSVAKIL